VEKGEDQNCAPVWMDEPQLVRRMHEMQSCGEESQKGTENEGSRTG